eukprot:9283545-Pyramimonas_sp.AAC.1
MVYYDTDMFCSPYPKDGVLAITPTSPRLTPCSVTLAFYHVMPGHAMECDGCDDGDGGDGGDDGNDDDDTDTDTDTDDDDDDDGDGDGDGDGD